MFFAHNGVASEHKSNFMIKNKLKMQEIREESLKDNLLEKVGLGNGKQPPSYQHKIIAETNYDKIDHTKSEHTMGLQVSKYIKIETDLDHLVNISKRLDLKQKELAKDNADSAAKINQANEKLIIRYCPKEEVLK